MTPHDTPFLVRNSAFLTASQILQIAVAFGANLVLVRFLLPADFGHFAIAFAGIALIFSLVSCRLNVLVIRATDEALAEAKDRYFSILCLETAVSAAVAGTWLLATTGTSLWHWSLIAALAVRHWVQQNKAFYERRMPYRALSMVESGASVLAHLAAVVLVATGMGPAVLYVREIVLTLMELVFLCAVGGLTFVRFHWIGLSGLRTVYREAAGVWVEGALENAYQRILILAIGMFGGAAAAGLFFQAYRLAIVPTQLLLPIIGRLGTNWMSRAPNPPERAERRARMIRIFFGPLLLAGVATYLWADPVVPWLFGENWQRSADLLAAMCGLVAFLVPLETLKSYCATARRMKLFLTGRILQYLAALAPLGVAAAGLMAGDMALALGQSIAPFVAFVFVATMLRRIERPLFRSSDTTHPTRG